MVSSVQCGLFTSVCTVLFSPVYFPGSDVLFHSVSSVRDMFRTLTKYCSHSAQVVSSVSFRTESLQDAFEILGTNQGSQRNSYTQYTLYPVSTRGKHRRLSSPTSNVRKGCNDTRMVLTIVNKPAEYEKDTLFTVTVGISRQCMEYHRSYSVFPCLWTSKEKSTTDGLRYGEAASPECVKGISHQSGVEQWKQVSL